MRIVVATDSFKESMSSTEAGQAIRRGIESVWPHASAEVVPVADGGEGTLAAAVNSGGFRMHQCTTVDALERPVVASYAVSEDGDVAIVECAEAVGLERIDPSQRDVWRSTSRGAGILILNALDCGVKTIILALGGVATNDAGLGMLAALGARFCDDEGNLISPKPANLLRISDVDFSGLDSRLPDVGFLLAADVDNPLLGVRGASAVFGPQKGATPEDVAQLDHQFAQVADMVHKKTGLNAAGTMGAGAAGGIGWAALTVLGASVRPGSEVLAEITGVSELIAQADLVFTGEGKTDGQTLGGKTAYRIARIAQSAGVPVILLAGTVLPGAQALHQHGVTAMLATMRELKPLEELLEEAPQTLEAAAQAACQLIELGRHLHE